jgi:hypothetical protein
MDRMTQQERKAVRMGFFGILLIVLGAKFMFSGYWQQYPPLELGSKPAVLFFTLEDSCECMQELVEKAENQIDNWPEKERHGIQIFRIAFEERKDLAGQYNVFRVPSLILIDSTGKIVYRQDFSITTREPFDLVEFRKMIQVLEGEAHADRPVRRGSLYPTLRTWS